ncbi:MAG TPA: flavin reductase family protein [Vicinamibacterales bacterium]|nr:flavin reductase family protein [Vicinamibacterales bacterium]
MQTATRKRTLRLLSNGLYVITSSNGDRYGGATASWLSQASFKPPLVMAAIRPESNVFECLVESRRAAVHVIGCGQKDMAERFFRPTTVTGWTMNGEPFAPGLTGVPVLQNAAAFFECIVRHICRLGDHAIVVMEVVEAECRAQIQPLTVAASPWEYGG